MNNNRNKVIKNFAWRFAERCGAQLVSFFVSIVLARLLAPEDYGTIALITVFIAILQVFVDSGLGNALIQKKDADDVDFSSVFYFNFVTCLVLYFAMFLSAPLIADFYNDTSLTALIRVLSLILVISGVKGIQQAYVSKHMLFKRFFFSTIGGTLFSALVGIWMAYVGFGVWALVAQQLSNAAIDTLILWMTVKWRPKCVFSWKRFQELFSFGWKLLVSALLDTVYNNLTNLIIGKKYSSSNLAYYNQGDKFPKLIITNINTSIDSVLLPTMAQEQDNSMKIKNMTRRAIKTSTYIMAPLMIGLAFCAEPVVRLILTEKWLPCVPFLQIFCVTYLFWPIHTANLNAIKAMGRSDLFLKLEIIKKMMGLAVLIVSMNISVLAMAYSLIITSVLGQIINTYPNKTLLKYGYLEQMKDILPAILLALFMGIGISVIKLFSLSDGVTIILQILLGIVIYIAGSAILHLDSYEYLLRTVKSFIYK